MNNRQLGPAILITAAFIGPGTVFTTSIAGANFGFGLVWALLFAVLATIVLQEMSGRLGIVTQKGLADNIRAQIKNPFARAIATLLVVGAIIIGNAAYQGGNISGAALGISALFDSPALRSEQTTLWHWLIGLSAFALLWLGHSGLLEKTLLVLVAVMSLAFIITFLLTGPDWSALLQGLFIPTLPEDSTLTLIALIGTTIVPYNLFLHSSRSATRWQDSTRIGEMRKDLYFAIPIGGLISIAIVGTAANAFFGHTIKLTSAADLAPTLAPLFGDSARYLIAIGLFSAGISSAITAPLAAAYALNEILNLKAKPEQHTFKAIWLGVLLLGLFIAIAGYKPVSVIWFAQIANGLLLPLIVIFLLWNMNGKHLGAFKNTWQQNLLGTMVLLMTLILSGKTIGSAVGLL